MGSSDWVERLERIDGIEEEAWLEALLEALRRSGFKVEVEDPATLDVPPWDLELLEGALLLELRSRERGREVLLILEDGAILHGADFLVCEERAELYVSATLDVRVFLPLSLPLSLYLSINSLDASSELMEAFD